LGDSNGLAGSSFSLGSGYTVRMDTYNYGGSSSFEMHIHGPSGEELGVFGPDGWIAKHGLPDAGPDLPQSVRNAIRGRAISQLRAMNVIPPIGRSDIRGKTLSQILRGAKFCVPFIGVAIGIAVGEGPGDIISDFFGGASPAY
jgi:hypothetical protein